MAPSSPSQLQQEEYDDPYVCGLALVPWWTSVVIFMLVAAVASCVG